MSGRLAVEFSVLGGHAEPQTWSCFSLAQESLSKGDLAGANALMEKQDQSALHPSVSYGARAMHAANRVMFAMRQDDLAAAVDWGNRLSEYRDLNNVMDVRFQAVPARLLIAQGEKTAAIKQLQDFYKKAEQAGAQGLIIKIRVYQSLAAETPDEAVTFLAEALKIGEPEGFIRTFVDEGKLLAPLLRKALAQGVTPEYTARLLNIIEAEERQRQARNGTTPSHLTPGILSGRELEILRLLETGLSNRQIAEKLVISLSTAKTHVHNISEKLNAKTRTQALARARELKLI